MTRGPYPRKTRDEMAAAVEAKRCVVCNAPTSGVYATCTGLDCGDLLVWGRTGVSGRAKPPPSPYAARFRKAAETLARKGDHRRARGFRLAAETSTFRYSQLPLFPPRSVAA